MMCRGVRNWPFVPDADELRKQVLVHVPFDIAPVVRREVEVVDRLDDGAQRRAIVDFQRRAAEEELARLREAWQLVQALDDVADRVEESIAGKRNEVAPAVPRPLP